MTLEDVEREICLGEWRIRLLGEQVQLRVRLLPPLHVIDLETNIFR